MLKLFYNNGQVKKYKIIINRFHKSNYLITVYCLSNSTKTINSYIADMIKICKDPLLGQSIICLSKNSEILAEALKEKGFYVKDI